MGQAGAAVREFVAGIQSSLECLTAAEESMGEDITEEQQVMLVAIYNKGVDEMNAVAANYNEQVRAFKSQ
jgi:triphosphoribosyl-dephospho-CoA synthetase